MVRSWLLRWFPQFRALELERDQLRDTVLSLQGEKLRLEDRLTAAVQDRDQLWQAFREANAGERVAYQMHVNVGMQKLGGGVPYPDAPHLPRQAVPEPSNEPLGRRGRILMSEVLQQRTDQFVRNATRPSTES